MSAENKITFEASPPGQKRFFSGGNLDALRQHLKDGVVNFGKLWVRAWDEPEIEFESSINWLFTREMIARKEGESFSEKVVITGIVPEKIIKRTGWMNDETEYIEGPVPIDGIFLIEGNFDNPVIKNITSDILSIKS